MCAAGPTGQLDVEQQGQAQGEGDLQEQRQGDDDAVVADGIPEQLIGEHPAEVVDADEIGEQVEPVPVVQAVAGARTIG